jgi:hypothetical protein
VRLSLLPYAGVHTQLEIDTHCFAASHREEWRGDEFV